MRRRPWCCTVGGASLHLEKARIAAYVCMARGPAPEVQFTHSTQGGTMRRLLGSVLCACASISYAASDYRDRLPEDEIVYFVLPDRFANGDPPTIVAGCTGTG
jgi:hypothetical protein